MGVLSAFERDLNQWNDDLSSWSVDESSNEILGYNDFVYFENPTRMRAFIGHKIEKSLKALFIALRSDGLMSRRVWVYAHGLFDNTCHMMELTLRRPTHDALDFLPLLDSKLGELDFSNPLTELEIEVLPHKFRRRSKS